MHDSVKQPDKTNCQIAAPSKSVDGIVFKYPDVVDLGDSHYWTSKCDDINNSIQNSLSIFLGRISFSVMNMF